QRKSRSPIEARDGRFGRNGRARQATLYVVGHALALHLQADLGGNRQALPTHVGPAGTEHASPLQRLLDYDRRHDRRKRRKAWPGPGSKPLKELKLATFNAPGETVAEKLIFPAVFK